jgi:indolepyruvate ferredoxin oxidoreductase beta subunit
MTKVSFLLAGVGGQGTILASDVLAAVGLQMGYDVKKSEVHGMAQRGGSVTSSVRWDAKVYSPLIGPGEADVFLAFEKLEALRHIEMLRPGGLVLVNDYVISPLSVSSGTDKYPDDERIKTVLSAVTPNSFFVAGVTLAESLGNARVNNVASKRHNVVLLGALSHFIVDIPLEAWLQAVRERVPAKFADLNERAFRLGRESMQELKSDWASHA